MGKTLVTDYTAETPFTVTAEGASGATITNVYSVTLPPSKEYNYVKVTAMIEILQAAGSTAQAITFDIRAGGKANSVAEDVSFEHTTRAVIDRILNTYVAILPNVNGGGTLKVQNYGAAADANTTITGRGLTVEAI